MTNWENFLIVASWMYCFRFGWVIREWKYESDLEEALKDIEDK